MICPLCGAFSPPDPETGADFDEVCPSCGERGFTTTSDGTIIRELDVDEPDDLDQVIR